MVLLLRRLKYQSARHLHTVGSKGGRCQHKSILLIQHDTRPAVLHGIKGSVRFKYLFSSFQRDKPCKNWSQLLRTVHLQPASINRYIMKKQFVCNCELNILRYTLTASSLLLIFYNKDFACMSGIAYVCVFVNICLRACSLPHPSALYRHANAPRGHLDLSTHPLMGKFMFILSPLFTFSSVVQRKKIKKKKKEGGSPFYLPFSHS